ATGAARTSYPMPDEGHCNDLAQDAHGNLYVTDSLHPRVLRFAPGAQALTIWAESPVLDGGGPYPGLNGIPIDRGRDIYVSRLALRSIAAGLNDPSSGDDRWYTGLFHRIEVPPADPEQGKRRDGTTRRAVRYAIDRAAAGFLKATRLAMVDGRFL